MEEFQYFDIALTDAKNNCVRQGAHAVVHLRSGTKFTGTLNESALAHPRNVHMRQGRGWVTIDRAQIAAVESTP